MVLQKKKTLLNQFLLIDSLALRIADQYHSLKADFSINDRDWVSFVPKLRRLTTELQYLSSSLVGMDQEYAFIQQIKKVFFFDLIL